ncbi:MAG: heme lyase CcmF/NrfE family subunit [Nitrospira sp. SB0677_bin_15]|nr:heme lyase CcmF/NrfE family subunit [Nitrospira sp. SB0667_bin_9]MYD31371.1 heme lyase CcmF/NrfE family subunit [Nitrospira sp. SB0661_bin_20]MYG40904.1 heme lyase CcmF/NrfE family subunit [Nitrospira sp. SB0677_bin_15]MYH02997.1 heme lyase CcmF/NrfE family subunit [Nitrospira sp. SB0675_bin_23]MYJ22672.1 heme lyase CcmF/NrfE family subunit [Nitrospira sp. SB0673_bin_12]
MIIEIGHFSAVIALVLAVFGIASSGLALRTHNADWVRAGRMALTLIFILLAVGMAALIYSFLARDFSVNYVATNSNSQLPLFYTIAAVWGGHEGSLLLWVFILSTFSTIAVWLHWRTQPAIMPYLIGMECLVILGFLLLILFLSSPFDRLIPAPPDGKDLNPLLQDPAMVMHPPMLYMGYVGFSIPFSFAMAALLSGRLGEEWIKVTQRWTIFAWVCLTTGILLGGYWAYYELGWGGYWGWDPVENASFMPWLVGTAFLHSVMVQEKRKMFKVWNLFLIIVTFSLSLIGTFLVRSGVLTSVHTFATDPERGLYILIFVTTIIGIAFGSLMLRANKLKSQIEMDSMVSRESVFLFNNLFFLVATATVFLGTLYPLMIETWQGAKVTVGPPYYNAVFMPIALGLLFLMGVGPYIPWRKASRASLQKNFLVPTGVGLVSTVVLFAIGIRSVFALTGAFVVGFSGAAIFIDFGKISSLYARRESINLLKGFLSAFTANQRRYSGLVTHVGVLVLVIGIIASTVYQTEKVVSMRVGDEFVIDDYRVKLKRIHDVKGKNWSAQEGVFEVYEGDTLLTKLRPQKRVYDASQTPTTESAIYAKNMGHIFLTMPDVSADGVAVARGVINPLILWVWGGGGIMGLGVLLNIFRPRKRDE